MFRFKFAFVAFALGLALLPGIALAQQRITVPGTSVSLEPPEGFSVATDFAGLVNKASSASVLIVEFPPVAYDQIAALFGDIEMARQNFARQQVAIDTIEMLDLPAGKVPLATGSQTIGTTKFDKWIALLKGAKTVLLTVQAPQQAKLDAGAVRKMLTSITLGEGPSVADKLKALPFTVTVAEPYRVVDTLGGLGVILTVGPLDTDPGDTQPSIILIYQQAPGVDLSNVEATSEQMLKATRGYENAQVDKKEATRFAGVDGLMTSGTRQRPDGAVRQFVHYLGVASQSRYIRLLASAETERMKELNGAIDAIAKSVVFKQP